jgi:hypothetical protein
MGSWVQRASGCNSLVEKGWLRLILSKTADSIGWLEMGTWVHLWTDATCQQRRLFAVSVPPLGAVFPQTDLRCAYQPHVRSICCSAPLSNRHSYPVCPESQHLPPAVGASQSRVGGRSEGRFICGGRVTAQWLRQRTTPFAVTSAPLASSVIAICTWPFRSALCSGVSPF